MTPPPPINAIPNPSSKSPSASPKPKRKTQQKLPTESDKGSKTQDIHSLLRKAFASKEKPIPKKITPEFDVRAYLTDDQMKSILGNIETPEDLAHIAQNQGLGEKPSSVLNSLDLLKSLASPPLHKNQVTAGSDESDDELEMDDDDDEEEEYIEFKFAPRQIFMPTICQVKIFKIQN